jgi:hypothetical protein
VGWCSQPALASRLRSRTLRLSGARPPSLELPPYAAPPCAVSHCFARPVSVPAVSVRTVRQPYPSRILIESHLAGYGSLPTGQPLDRMVLQVARPGDALREHLELPPRRRIARDQGPAAQGTADKVEAGRMGGRPPQQGAGTGRGDAVQRASIIREFASVHAGRGWRARPAGYGPGQPCDRREQRRTRRTRSPRGQPR